jgi:hypothetical protein
VNSGDEPAQTPEQAFMERALTPQVRQSGSVGHALLMCAWLPDARESARDSIVQIACLEAWFVNVRLIVEFLGLGGKGGDKDFSAKSFGFELPGAAHAEYGALNDLWLVASQQVVHFSKQRTPEKLADLDEMDVSVTSLRSHVEVLLGLFDLFVTHLESTGHPTAESFRMHLAAARQPAPRSS